MITEIDVNGTPVKISHAIIEKTAKIFEQRILVFFLDKPIPPNILDILFKIQLIIFIIDDYYETTWNYDQTQSQPFWNEIISLLLQLGIAQKNIGKFLKDIKAYEKIEQAIRSGTTPDRMELKQFYYLKSCDVRLQRHLAQFIQTGEICISTAEQIDFDIAGEILDDIDDLEEDQLKNTYNGNRLLFCLQKQGPKAIDEYKNYLNQIK